MTDRIFTTYDVDTERLAEVLRDIADDIEERGVAIDEMATYTYADADSGDLTLGLGFELTPMVGSKTIGTLANQYQE